MRWTVLAVIGALFILCAQAQEFMEIPIDDIAVDPGIITEQPEGLSFRRNQSMKTYIQMTHQFFRDQGYNIRPEARNYRLLLGRIAGELERNRGAIDVTALNMYIRSYNNVLDLVQAIDDTDLPGGAKAMLAQYYFDIASHPRFKGVEQELENIQPLIQRAAELYVGKLDKERSLVKLCIQEYPRFRQAGASRQRRLLNEIINLNPYADAYVGKVSMKKRTTMSASERRALEQARFLNKNMKPVVTLTTEERRLDSRYYVQDGYDYVLLIKPEAADRMLR